MLGKTVSHYRITEKLGEGGMGVVYKARDTALERDVALKFLPPGMAGDLAARHRFVREARAASALDHPNIAVVHEIGESSDGGSFICMAYYDGETLRRKIDGGPMEIRPALEIAIQIADGLQRAHGAGITHLDIKPANIIVTRENVAKILDFGLAKLNGEGKSTSTGHRGGTAHYMSPEQVLGTPTDHRSDLFSFGVLLYEMITGRRPFEGEHEAALFYTLLNTDPIPLSVRRIGVPERLQGVIERLLRKDPQRRYQSASEVQAELAAVLKNLNRATASSAASAAPARTSAAAGSGRSRAGRRLLAGTAVAALIALGVYGLWRSLRGPAIDLKRAEYVVVADFGNETGNPVFDHALTEAVRVSLWQSAYINLLAPERVSEALVRMRVENRDRLDEPTALAVAKREGARLVVAGTIDPLGSGFALNAKIIDAARGEILRLPKREIASMTDVLAGIDALCEEIRRTVGEPLQEIARSALPLRRVTTPSLEALELYSQGERMELSGRYHEAADLKGRAAGIDSLFTMAVSDLSYIHRKLGNDSLAIAWHERVLPLIDRVTDRERCYILTTYYGPSFEFDFGKAYAAAREMVNRYPDDAEAHGQLGYLAMYFCELETARDESMKSLALDSTFAPTLYNNSGYAAALSGDVAAALALFSRSRELRPAYTATDAYIAHARWVGGSLDSAEANLRDLLRRGDLRRRYLTRAQLAALLLARGRLADARAECDSGISAAKQATPPLPDAYFHYLAGEAFAAGGDAGGFRREMRLAELRDRAPYTELALVGVSYARNGMRDAAASVLGRLAGLSAADPFFVRRKPDFLRLVRGSILSGDRDFAGARAEFEAVEKVHCGDPLYATARFLSAECAEGGPASPVIEEYLRLLRSEGELVMGPILSYPSTGSWTGLLIPEIHLRLAERFAAGGDRRAALEHLDATFRYWNGPGTAGRRFRDARALRQKLDAR